MGDDRGIGAVDEQTLLRAIVEGTATETGEAFFVALVRTLARALGVHGAWVTEFLARPRRLRALAFWLGDGLVPEYEYDVRGTPCEAVIDRAATVHIPDRAVELYPADLDLARLSAVSYLGTALVDGDGTILGHLAVLDTRPMPSAPGLRDVFGVFAERATAELRRLRLEHRLREREAKLAGLIDGAMDGIVELDAALRVTRANPAAVRLFGAAIHGADFAALLDPAGAERLRHLARELTAAPGPARAAWMVGGFRARGADGDEFPAEATLSCVHAGDEVFHTLILRNVDERLAAERRIQSLEDETAYLREEIRALRPFDRIVGTSPALLATLRQVDRVAETDATVLVLGETGTGKELIARAIHEAGRRRTRPLVRVNCAAIPEHLIESELFGHERGAFTGAVQRREGRFALADGGTLFLDEIGELPPALQPKLLRVLQEGEFEPVGSARTRRVDVRIIAATNRDLPREIARGAFREDLYYRLNVFPIRVPPLRERGEDVVLLAAACARRIARDLGREVAPLDEAAKIRLRAYPWPGNVRELENVIERAVITAEHGRLDLSQAFPEAPPPALPRAVDSERVRTVDEMRDLERANLVRALELAGWKVAGQSGAARLLGVSPSTLASRMKALGIRRPGG
jgi:PAS domain S-box-containing protein